MITEAALSTRLAVSTRRCWGLLAPLLFCGLSSPANLSAQRIRFDPLTGDYFATVYNDALEPVEMRIVPADKVVGTAVVALSATGNDYEYTYSITLDPEGPQGLITLRVPCAPAEQFELLQGVASTNDRTGPWYATTVEYQHGSYCGYFGGAVPLRVGGSLEATLRTARLPAIGRLHLVGAHPGLQEPWPTFDPIPENDTIRAFIKTVDGVAGGWKEITSIIPSRDPLAFVDPLSGLSLIDVDLTEICGTLNWITSTEVCDRLAAGLATASAAVPLAAWAEARAALTGVLSTLGTHHDPAGPQSVNGDAFHLLSTNVQVILASLPDVPFPVASGSYSGVEGSPAVPRT